MFPSTLILAILALTRTEPTTPHVASCPSCGGCRACSTTRSTSRAGPARPGPSPRSRPSGRLRDDAPSLSPDGTRLFFDSRRPDPSLDDDSIGVFTATRRDGGWSAPTLLTSPSLQPPTDVRAARDESGSVVDGDGSLSVYRLVA